MQCLRWERSLADYQLTGTHTRILVRPRPRACPPISGPGYGGRRARSDMPPGAPLARSRSRWPAPGRRRRDGPTRLHPRALAIVAHEARGRIARTLAGSGLLPLRGRPMARPDRVPRSAARRMPRTTRYRVSSRSNSVPRPRVPQSRRGAENDRVAALRSRMRHNHRPRTGPRWMWRMSARRARWTERLAHRDARGKDDAFRIEARWLGGGRAGRGLRPRLLPPSTAGSSASRYVRRVARRGPQVHSRRSRSSSSRRSTLPWHREIS